MDIFAQSAKYFNTPLQLFQFFDKYSRYNYDLGRRETWIESIDRVISFLHDLADDGLDHTVYEELRLGMLNMQVMPSMRLLAMAGPAAHRNNISIYNCSFLGVDDIAAFGEALLISMNGCGVGYSVERKFVDKLPPLPKELTRSGKAFIIPDDTEGWQAAVNYQIERFYDGEIIDFDYSHIRPAGSVLRVKGGRASGPQPLQDTLDFIEEVFLAHYNCGYLNPGITQLSPIDVHDIMCAVGNAAVSGGVRRTAMISLFDMDDERMLKAKSGHYNPYRYNANNSVVWDHEISQPEFLWHMGQMFKEDNGEPAIFNRHYLGQQIPDRRDSNHILGVNPCGEIILRHMQFCNLTAAVARADDTIDDLRAKVKLASILGTIQSTATNFPGLRREWEDNCKEERLLGVDITGQRDCPLLNESNGGAFATLQDVAIGTNSQFAKRLGVNASAAVTCVKPSGNTSVLVDCASGLHARPFPYYMRNVLVDKRSPVCTVLQDSGVPMTPYRNETYIVHFPVKAPEGAVVENGQTAIDQLDYWAMNKRFYTEHNPSVTIKYQQHEILDIIQWLWNNKSIIGGITFMPILNGNYDYLPIEQITKEEYAKRIKEFPEIDFSRIQMYESQDMTTAAQEVACSAGVCEIV